MKPRWQPTHCDCTRALINGKCPLCDGELAAPSRRRSQLQQSARRRVAELDGITLKSVYRRATRGKR
jgi:hypothetical protein